MAKQHSPGAAQRRRGTNPGAQCHSQAKSQPFTCMGRALETVEECGVLIDRPVMTVTVGKYSYRISKCYDADDARISCLACHDPHHELSAETTDYDPKCQACHGGGKPGAKACPVSKSKCASCDMPKLELPGAHYKFSDHRIRIVKPTCSLTRFWMRSMVTRFSCEAMMFRRTCCAVVNETIVPVSEA